MDRIYNLFFNLRNGNVPYTVILDIFSNFEKFKNTTIQFVNGKYSYSDSEDFNVLASWSKVVDSYITFRKYLTYTETIVDDTLKNEIEDFDLFIRTFFLCNCNMNLLLSLDKIIFYNSVEDVMSKLLLEIINPIENDIIRV